MTEESSREFYRAEVRLPVYYGADDPEARQSMAMGQELWNTHARLEQAATHALDSEMDASLKPLVPVLKWLDFKLDLVLHQLRSREQGRFFPYHGITADLSGSGIGLAEPAHLPPGSRVVVCLPLPNQPSRPVMALGEVARSEDDGGPVKAAIRFVEISETDQERIIHYTFQKQREELARRSGETKP